MKTFKKITYFLIFIGVMAFVINTIFGSDSQPAVINMLVKTQTNGITYYKLDMWIYIQNIQTSLDQITYLNLEMPSRTWENLQVDFWAQLGNNLALMLDWLIFLINVIIYPFRIGAYCVKECLVVIGVNIAESANHGLTWLVDLVNFLVKLAIPYV